METLNTVVITGATSLIGKAVMDACLVHGVRKIYAVMRPDSKKQGRIPNDERISVIECAAEDYGKLGALITDTCDAFYHFAWCATGRDRDTNVDAQALNIQYALKALKAAKDLGCKRFIGAGSQAEYGRLDVDRIRPDSPVHPETPYGIAKYASGRMARILADQLGIACIWVRIFSVYGANDKPTTLVSNVISKLKSGEHMPLTQGIQRWDYLNSRDAGEAFYRIGERVTGSKVYCLGSGEARPLKEYIEMIRDSIDPGLELGFGEIPYTDGSVMNLCADISDLEADTGWRPAVPFQEGIKEIIETGNKSR